MQPKIRLAQTSDAEALLSYMRRLVAEPDNNIPLLPEELPGSAEIQARQIESVITSDVSALFLAFEANEVIGRLDINGFKRAALAHVVSFGVSVDGRFRRHGIGFALISAGIDWVESRPQIRRIELEVHARNQAAICLYQKFGFVEEGKQEQRLYQHGRYFDTLRMARFASS